MIVTVPVHTVSNLNVREHWRSRAQRAKSHRNHAALALHTAGVPRAPATAVVTLTRVAPRPLDGDNLQGALKSVRDGVADWLQIDDGSARIEWRYAQRKGAPKTCLLQVPGICNGDCSTVVAAHSNLSIHGKAGARKADDQYHVYACFSCHQWLDQGGAPAAVKSHAFMQAHLWMVDIWRGIVAGFVDATPKDKAAAQWALDRLNATSVGQAA